MPPDAAPSNTTATSPSHSTAIEEHHAFLTATTTTSPFRPTTKVDYNIEDFRAGAIYLRGKTLHRPKLAIILGSGMTDFIDAILEKDVVPYAEMSKALPGFPNCSVAGHAGNFIFGKVGSAPVMVMQGRFHLYEGHSVQAITYPIRIMKEFGIEYLILTNAAGGLSPNLAVGDVMVITDHFNTLWGMNHPLGGPNIDSHGPRFLACHNLYDLSLQHVALRVAKERGVKIKLGTYIYTSGPSYETPLEVRLYRTMGERRTHLGPIIKAVRGWCKDDSLVAEVVDWVKEQLDIHEAAVGMSTVPEVLVAKHAGIRVLAMSGISNMCVDDIYHVDSANHEEVQKEMTNLVVPKVIALVRGIIELLGYEEHHDFAFDVDSTDLLRWRVPTQLCVPWKTFWLYSSFTALLLTAAFTPLLSSSSSSSSPSLSSFRPPLGWWKLTTTKR